MWLRTNCTSRAPSRSCCRWTDYDLSKKNIREQYRYPEKYVSQFLKKFEKEKKRRKISFTAVHIHCGLSWQIVRVLQVHCFSVYRNDLAQFSSTFPELPARLMSCDTVVP